MVKMKINENKFNDRSGYAQLCNGEAVVHVHVACDELVFIREPLGGNEGRLYLSRIPLEFNIKSSSGFTIRSSNPKDSRIVHWHIH